MGTEAVNVPRLREAMKFSLKKLSPFRQKRAEVIKQYVGKNYSDDGATQKVPLNLIELAVSTYSRLLAANNPQVQVSTKSPQLRPVAATTELALNHLIRKIKLVDSIQMVVMNALFSVGIMKCGQYSSGTVNIDGMLHDVGQPFADSVDLDDWVHDMTAKRFEECQYAGNRYRLPLAAVQESDLYDKVAREKLTATHKLTTNEGGDEQIAGLSGVGGAHDDGEYADFVELWDLWLPFENKIVTIAAEDASGSAGALRTVDWDGPETGPFHMLSFAKVPNNIMPLSPAAGWMDLHTLVNAMYRKLGRQAERQKTVLLVREGKQKEGEKRMKANDGDVLSSEDPANCQEASTGGPNQTSLAFAMGLKQEFSYFGGNIDSIAGMGPQAPTLGQDQMIQQNSSKRLQDMQEKTLAMTKGVIQNLAWYLWHDPLIELPLVKRIPGVARDIPVMFSPETRSGDYDDYNFDIQPFSMQEQTPQTKVAALDKLLMTIAPLLPMLQQSGRTINIDALLRAYGKNLQIDEIESLFQFSMPPENPQAPVGQAPAKAGSTTRNYVRQNVSQATRTGKSSNLQQMLLGKAVQPNEAAAAVGG